MPLLSQSTSESLSRWYSRRHRPSTVTVTPRAPPSLVSPSDSRAPPPTATPRRSSARESSIAATSTRDPEVPASSQSDTSSPTSFASVGPGGGGGEVTPSPELLLPPRSYLAGQADVRLSDVLLIRWSPPETSPLGSDERLYLVRNYGERVLVDEGHEVRRGGLVERLVLDHHWR
jgi:hypothetical protein